MKIEELEELEVKEGEKCRGEEGQDVLTSQPLNLSTSAAYSSSSSSKAFTLIEVLIVLVIVSFLMAISVVGFKKFTTSLEYSNAVNQVVSDVKLTQQLACASSQTCRIEFKAGKNEYNIMKGTSLYRSVTAGNDTQFYGKSYFSFAPSGNTDVGGSGTVLLGAQPTAKKIVVSSRGRIRVE